jgi:hypothetical protein
VRDVLLVAVFAIVLVVGLGTAALYLVVRTTVAAAGWLRGPARRLGAAAREPDHLAVAAASRLSRLADPSELSALRLRVQLRRTTTAAATAVQAADRAGAPVGDLPDVVTRLRRHAAEVERRLADAPAGVRGRGPSLAEQSARADAEAVIAMALEAHHAAAEAHGAVNGTATRALAADVGEVVAGVRAAAAWLRDRGVGGTRPGAA